jgi:nanoRNase/pAp phosphatase (c-di-AMP/oligoRNAs hydrolase)
MLKKYRNKLEQFRAAVTPASSALILTHDYPDPDCIASAYGLSELLSFWGVKSPVISFGGFVGRAENRAMIRCLGIPAVPFASLDAGGFDKVILVDCYPGRGNVSLPAGAAAHAVIDHHRSAPPPDAPFFHDIRPEYGAASTIVTRYLLQAGCRISETLATALFNGIKADTGGIRRASADDIACYKRLFDIMDHKLLAKIENPARDAEFFRVLREAVEAAVRYDNVGYAHLGTVASPDCIAEMAEFLHRWEKLEWMICAGVFNKQIYFSIRSETLDKAGLYAERLAERFGGSGGGHSKAAAGRFPAGGGGDIRGALDKMETAVKEIFGAAWAAREPLLPKAGA